VGSFQNKYLNRFFSRNLLFGLVNLKDQKLNSMNEENPTKKTKKQKTKKSFPNLGIKVQLQFLFI
jgi:hypothetical protein